MDWSPSERQRLRDLLNVHDKDLVLLTKRFSSYRSLRLVKREVVRVREEIKKVLMKAEMTSAKREIADLKREEKFNFEQKLIMAVKKYGKSWSLLSRMFEVCLNTP